MGFIKDKLSLFLAENSFGMKFLSDNKKISLIKDYEKNGILSQKAEDLAISISSDDKLVSLIKDSKLLNNRRSINYIVSFRKSDSFSWKLLCEDECFNIDLRSTALSIKDSSIKKEIIRNYSKYNLTLCDFFEMFDGINDDDFIKEIILNRAKLNLDSNSLIKVLSMVYKDDFKKYVIANYEQFGFKSSELGLLIATVRDDSYKKGVIKDCSKYGLSYYDLPIVIISLRDKLYMRDKLNNLFGFDNYSLKEIDLPKDMTIGIEIESEGDSSVILNNLELLEDWTSKSDFSLQNGVEVTSPILRPGKDDEVSIYEACKMISLCDQGITLRCGGHVHIGASYFGNDMDAYKNFVELYSNCENILYIISNEKEEVPRVRVLEYGTPISGKLEKALDSGSISFDNAYDVESFANEIWKVQNSKFNGINFQNLGLLKNTIEFRMANGTLDPNVWISNINLFGGMMVASKRVSVLRRKDYSKLMDEEKEFLSLFDKISLKDISVDDKLDIFLKLVVKEEDRDLYMERYISNNMMNEGSFTDEQLKKKMCKKPIKITSGGNEFFEGFSLEDKGSCKTK